MRTGERSRFMDGSLAGMYFMDSPTRPVHLDRYEKDIRTKIKFKSLLKVLNKSLKYSLLFGGNLDQLFHSVRKPGRQGIPEGHPGYYPPIAPVHVYRTGCCKPIPIGHQGEPGIFHWPISREIMASCKPKSHGKRTNREAAHRKPPADWLLNTIDERRSTGRSHIAPILSRQRQFGDTLSSF